MPTDQHIPHSNMGRSTSATQFFDGHVAGHNRVFTQAPRIKVLPIGAGVKHDCLNMSIQVPKAQPLNIRASKCFNAQAGSNRGDSQIETRFRPARFALYKA